MNQITIDGETYPIYCDLLVLEKIQDEYESVNQFERELLGYEILRDENGEPLRAEDGTLLMAAKEPKMKAISPPIIRFLYGYQLRGGCFICSVPPIKIRSYSIKII